MQLDDGSPRVLKIEKAKLISSSRTGLPFIYVNKDKSVPDHEYLYPGPPGEVIAAEEAAIAAQFAALAKEKAEAAEQRSRVTKDAMAALTKELKAAPRSFEVRGLNLGRDHLQDIADAVGYQAGKGTDVEGFPDTRKEIGSDGGILYFYRGILFMASYDDLQDSLDIRAAMDKLEAKFKGKFAKVPQQKSRDGNTETTTVGYRMNIGGFGVADVQLSSSRPIVRSVCISDIARQMQLNIRLGIKNYSSLSDRVDSECKETLNPTQLVFIHKPIEALINARATAQRQANARQEAADKLKSASEKASKF